MAEMVMELANVTQEVAEEALAKYEEVWLAVDSLIQKPAIASDRYIPEKPKACAHLTSEQKEMCDRGRWLQDKVNAVFSVAHSKIQPEPEALVEQHDRVPPSSPEGVFGTEPQSDCHEKSPPLALQSASIH